MKFIGKILAVCLLAASCVSAQAPQGVTKAKDPTKKPFIKRAIVATAICGVGIGVSTNPATAAEIGVPILIGGNALAYKLRVKHPKWSAFIQTLSPAGCFYFGHTPKPKPQIHTHKPPTVDPPGNGGTT